jgi:transposase InsO family protein
MALFVTTVRALFRSRADLALENLALRQQVAVLEERRPRPPLTGMDRALWVALQQNWKHWANALIIVQPETVVRWHRKGFKLYWRWKSRPRGTGRPRADRKIPELIRKMATENVGWGAPKIHGELVELGFNVSERTVSRYMPKRPVRPDAIERWTTFLRNHREVVAACDYFTAPTVTFDVLYVFFVIHHARRTIVHINVTGHPTAAWVIQQLREAVPFDTAPKYLIIDRDSKFSEAVHGAIKAMGTKAVKTAYRSPWQNGVAERWVGSCRRDVLDQVVVLGEPHLLRLLDSYVAYHHKDRTHLGLSKDTPTRRAVTPKPSLDAKVVALPRVGGLHHRYEWRDSA